MNKPILKKKKSNSLKLFNKIAKRAYKVSKKRKLGWKWSDAQKWTSKNMFQKYKGTKNLSKLKATTLDQEVIGILDGTIVVPPVITTTQKQPKRYCFSPFDVGSYLFETFEWFDIEDKVDILNNDLQVDLDLEFDGSVFAKTGVIKKDMLPNLKQVREDMRKLTNKSGYFPLIAFYIVLIDGAEDDRSIPCNYYVLITFEGSDEYTRLSSKGLIKRAFVSKEQMPTSERERIELINKQKEEEKKILSKQKAQKFTLPSKVEPVKVEPAKAEPQIKNTKANRLAEYNKAVDKLESLLEKKLITKKQFQERFKQLGKNLKDGGEV
jgi:hypothetical protein